MRVLLIEDDVQLSAGISDLLEDHGIEVDQAHSGEEGLDLSRVYTYQIVILDLGLPDMQGDAVLSSLRENGNGTPVLVLSGESDVDVRSQFLTIGADDFLVKPFNATELVARIHALVRRCMGRATNIVTCGALTLDLRTMDVHLNGQRIYLTCKEYQILELFCIQRGHVVTKTKLLDHLYGGIDEPEVKIIDVFICTLRKKLEAYGVKTPVIETVWRRGYRLDTENSLGARKATRTTHLSA